MKLKDTFLLFLFSIVSLSASQEIVIQLNHPSTHAGTLSSILKTDQLYANGKICVNWTDDDAERYGNRLEGGKLVFGK